MTLALTDPIFQDVPLHDQSQLTTWLTEHPERAEEIFAYLAKQNMLPALRNTEAQLEAVSVLERLQFDGDVPEARVDPLMEGFQPAVPVQTVSLNPIEIGLQLQVASEETLALLQGPDSSERTSASTELACWEPEHYKTGLPAKKSLGKTVDITLLSDAQRQQAYWLTISSTQGRESACFPIQLSIADVLGKNGYRVIRADPVRMVAKGFWRFSAFGKADQSLNFNPLTTAVGVMSQQILAELRELSTVPTLCVEVVPIHDMANRNIGWVATAYAAEEVY